MIKNVYTEQIFLKGVPDIKISLLCFTCHTLKYKFMYGIKIII